MQDRNEPTTLAQIEASLDFFASFEGRTVRTILEAGLKNELESHLSFLLTKAEEALRYQEGESYW